MKTTHARQIACLGAAGLLLAAVTWSINQPTAQAAILAQAQLEATLGGAAPCVNPSVSQPGTCNTTGRLAATACPTNTPGLCVSVTCPGGGNCCAQISMNTPSVCQAQTSVKTDCTLTTNGNCAQYSIITKSPAANCGVPPNTCPTPNVGCGSMFTTTTLIPCT
jgi:hypothetical protein